MKLELQHILHTLDEAIEYCEALGHVWTRYYVKLLRQRRVIRRALKKFCDIEDRYRRAGKI